jgi:hypothetical protein
MTYQDQLKDPRWQKKRLRILNRDKFRCQVCGSKTKTLNIHHLVYKNGKKPWEYEDYHLLTVCQECHNEYDQKLDYLLKTYKNNLIESGFSIGCFMSLYRACAVDFNNGTLKIKRMLYLHLKEMDKIEKSKPTK